jgi:hypothetical protein
MAAEVKGEVASGLEPVRDAFAEVLRTDPVGAALAVDLDAELVVDLFYLVIWRHTSGLPLRPPLPARLGIPAAQEAVPGPIRQ